MINEPNKSEKDLIIRQKAEELLKDKQAKERVHLSEADIKRLLYELEVHQIELEMQNDELQLAKTRAEIIAEKYAILFDFAPSGYFTLSYNGEICELNLSGASLLGKERSKLINSHFNLYVTTEFKLVFSKFMEQVFKSQVSQTCEVQLRTAEDRLVFVHLDGIVSDNGEHCLIIAVDITDRVKAEADLKEAKEKAERNKEELNKAQNIAHLGSWYLDLASNDVIWTEELYRMYGFDPRLPVPPYTEHMKLFTPESWEILSTSLKKTSETGIPYELELKTIRKDGSNGWMWARGEAITDTEGKIVSLWGAAQDISERKQIEEKIIESNDLNQSLLRTIPFGINIVDLKGNILFMSENLIKQYGSSAIGKKCWEIFHDDHQQGTDCPLLSEHLANETKIYETSKIFGGKTFQVNHTSMVYKGQKALLCIFQDITEKKRQEMDLIEAKDHAEESDRLKSAFLANMSHEIRTPMNGILGFASLLKEPDLSVNEQKKFIQIIEKSGVRMLSIINDIVNISKIESGLMDIHMDETNINDQIKYIHTFFKPEADGLGMPFTYNNTLPKKDAFLTTDREKFYAILTNLVKNALKYALKGSLELGYVKKPGFFEFYVKDTGVGIPKERQSAIFKRFVQADISGRNTIQGSGLGLSISQAYVEMLGGKIWLESEEGKGSTFYFTLPVEPVLQSESSLFKETPPPIAVA